MGENVLVAMTGGIESTIAAYLLKKQGYNCIGVALQLFEEGEEAGPFRDMIVTDFFAVKAICNYLEIPFYVVNAVSIFQDRVLDFAIGRALSGQTYEPGVFYNSIMIEVMQEKAKKFNTKWVATGHYAKVLKNQKSGVFEIMVANDLINDQSYLLSRLESRLIDGLILPLSETRKEEVLKLSELLKVNYVNRDKSNRSHLMHDSRMISLIEARASKDLRKPGTIYKYTDDTNYGEHPGIHHFYIGKKNIKVRQDLEIDPEMEVISIVPFKANVFLGYLKDLSYKHALLVQFKAGDGLDMSIPIHAFVKKGPTAPKVACILYIKNNKTCIVEYLAPQTGTLIAGQFLAFYTREGEKGKVIGSGIVDMSGTFVNGSYHNLPNKNKKIDEEDENEDLNLNEKLFF